MMKKLLLFLAVAAIIQTATAENRVYSYGEDPGTLNRVSSNGHWAVGADDYFQTGSYLIDIVNDPANYISIEGGELYDVTNDCLCVGSEYEISGTEEAPIRYPRAAYWKDGVWTRLPLPAEVYGRSYARCVSADGKYIGGMASCYAKDSDIGGKYYPCLWTWNDETKEYDLTCYNNLDLPANQGFIVNDMTEDGTTLVGYVYAYAGSTVPAMVKNGAFVCWNKMEWKEWSFEYKGKKMVYDAGFIDDIEEGAEEEYWFDGGLNYICGDYVFGHHSVASNVDPETATGTVRHKATIYNLATDEFIDESNAVYGCGVDPDHKFSASGTTGKYLTKEKGSCGINDYFNLKGDVKVAGVYGMDDSQMILACSFIWMNEALGEYSESPALVILDKPLLEQTAVEQVKADNEGDGIVYDLQGRKMSQAALAPGIYVKDHKKFVVK